MLKDEEDILSIIIEDDKMMELLRAAKH